MSPTSRPRIRRLPEGFEASASELYTSKTVSNLVTCSRSPTRLVRFVNLIVRQRSARSAQRHKRAQSAGIDIIHFAQVEHDAIIL